MTLEKRFWAKVQKTDTCWLWTASLHTNGYGQFRVSPEKAVQAHRLAYEWLVGPIPKGLELDHLCRVRRCVNPSHLEPVTRSENNRRGLLSYALRDKCRSGRHDITDPANVITRSDGRQQCRACVNLAQMDHYYRTTTRKRRVFRR